MKLKLASLKEKLKPLQDKIKKRALAIWRRLKFYGNHIKHAAYRVLLIPHTRKRSLFDPEFSKMPAGVIRMFPQHSEEEIMEIWWRLNPPPQSS